MPKYEIHVMTCIEILKNTKLFSVGAMLATRKLLRIKEGFSCRLHKIHVNIYKVEINSLSSFGHLLNNICYYEKHGLI